MSLHSDAATLTISNAAGTDVGGSLTSPNITISIPNVTSTLEVYVPTGPDTVEIQVPGPQGLQNVYVQSANPATQYGWGAAQAGFILMEILP